MSNEFKKKQLLILVLLIALAGIVFLFFGSEDSGRYVEFGGNGGAVLDTKTAKVYVLKPVEHKILTVDVLEEAKKSESESDNSFK